MATSKAAHKGFDDMTGPELVAEYNRLTGDTVKRFSDRKTALRRVREAAAASKSKQPKGKAKKAKATGGESKRRRGFNFPVAAGGPKTIQEGTNRARLAELLEKGATFKECVQKAGFKDERNTYQAIRLLHTYVGYGMKEEGGVIRLIS